MIQKSDMSKKYEPMRLNKFLAHSGICSRRKAVEYIKDGLVLVNGKSERNPAVFVQKTDKVVYKGQKVRPEFNKVYYLMNKPKNLVTTVKDERGRPTVMDIIDKRVKERVYPVGRLDRATTGLLLFTNDGDLAKKLSHPSHEIKKVYHVILDKEVSENDLELIREGIQLKDGMTDVDAVDYYQERGKQEIGIELHSGKNRIIRRIFEHLGYRVEKLDRVFYAGLTKKDLPRGWIRKLTNREVIMLKHFV